MSKGPFKIRLLASTMAVAMGLGAATPAMAWGCRPQRPRAVKYGLSIANGFVKGVGEGAWRGVKSTVSGVGHVVEGGYKLTTDSHYRERVSNSAVDAAKAVRNIAVTGLTDPGRAADDIGNTASHARDALETAYNQAAACGQGSEFIGLAIGEGAVLLGPALVPGGSEVDVVGVIDDTGRAASLAGDAGKAAAVTDDASKAAAVGDANAVETADRAGARFSFATERPDNIAELAEKKSFGKAEGRHAEAESEVQKITPTWRQSEVDVGKDLGPGFLKQQSYLNGKLVPYGTEGSVRPDFVAKDGSVSVEVKNYDIATNSETLIDNIAEQARYRDQHLPKGMRQEVVIDVRGQEVSAAQENTIIEKIVRKSGGVIGPDNITFKVYG